MAFSVTGCKIPISLKMPPQEFAHNLRFIGLVNQSHGIWQKNCGMPFGRKDFVALEMPS